MGGFEFEAGNYLVYLACVIVAFLLNPLICLKNIQIIILMHHDVYLYIFNLCKTF